MVGGGGGLTGVMVPRLQFLNQKGPTVLVSNIRGIAFYGCSETVWIRNFTIFTVCVLQFWDNIQRATSHFSNYTEEIDNFLLNFLKISAS